MTSIDARSSIEAGGSAILRDTGVIVWKWPCVLPLVTCLSVMVTSHCGPFLYNYPCYLSNWHCLSLALTVEVLNAWCAWWWTRFLSLCSWDVLFHILLKLIRENVFFFFFSGFWALSCTTKFLKCVCIRTQLSLLSFLFYSMHQWNDRLSIFHLSSITTNAKPTSAMIIASPWVGEIANVPLWYC